jgi:hypothetical protein
MPSAAAVSASKPTASEAHIGNGLGSNPLVESSEEFGQALPPLQLVAQSAYPVAEAA